MFGRTRTEDHAVTKLSWVSSALNKNFKIPTHGRECVKLNYYQFCSCDFVDVLTVRSTDPQNHTNQN